MKNKINQNEKEILNNKSYYIQDMDFNEIKYSKKSMHVIFKKDHIPIVIGEQREVKTFDKKKSWLLDSYPAMIMGSTGSGRVEFLISMSRKFIENSEGLIYFDANGNNMLYSKMFMHCQEAGRVSDLYCLNFVKNSLNMPGNESKKNSHSIDPINPMLGNDDYFKKFFGAEFGMVVHSILRSINERDQLMDIPSLEACMMLNNLISWSNDKFKEVNEIKNYLKFLNISDEQNEDEFEKALIKHAFCCEKAEQTLKIFKLYPNVFRYDCSVDMEEIFLKRKVLIILLPALERSIEDMSITGELVLSQIVHWENKLREYKNHNQNIIIDEFNYFGQELEKINFNGSFNNYIFSCYEIYPYKNSLVNHLVFSSNTLIYMKLEDPQSIHSKVKVDVFDNIKNLSIDSFKKNMPLSDLFRYLQSQSSGQAVVFAKNNLGKIGPYINNKFGEYYVSPIKCIYIPVKRAKNVFLVDHGTTYEC